MKHPERKPPFTKRTGIPKIVKDKNGAAILLCPFCNPSHPLLPNQVAKCGTSLSLTAEQVIVHAKFDKKFTCVKCGKGGGDMVQYQNGFIHVKDCSPEVMTMTEAPNYSKLAGWVHGLKNEKLKKFMEGFTGKAVPVQEVDPKGARTGVILGHFFLKEMKHAEHEPEHPVS